MGSCVLCVSVFQTVSLEGNDYLYFWNTNNIKTPLALNKSAKLQSLHGPPGEPSVTLADEQKCALCIWACGLWGVCSRLRTLDFGGCYLLAKEALDHFRHHCSNTLRQFCPDPEVLSYQGMQVHPPSCISWAEVQRKVVKIDARLLRLYV